MIKSRTNTFIVFYCKIKRQPFLLVGGWKHPVSVSVFIGEKSIYFSKKDVSRQRACHKFASLAMSNLLQIKI